MSGPEHHRNFVFFLGGHDAEMCEIAEILKSLDIPFYDKHLGWENARVSMYLDEIRRHKNKQCVFIELEEDIKLPPESTSINHHNEDAGKEMPSSLEQVADILGITLTRRQHLIAINDKAHIKGMKEAGAVPEEIREIRAFDRQCQGVTEEEEAYAEKTAAQFRSAGLLDVLEIPYSRTSPFTDRLYGMYKNLLIITPVDINFFGNGKVVLQLHNRYDKSWCGGNLPEQGFWGIQKTHAGNTEEITCYIKERVCSTKK